MIVLALDTAGVDCSAALYDSDTDEVLAEVSETIGRGHAERLMSFVETCVDQSGLTLDHVDRIAVTIGPGSFTGIRVGVAAARGFALALGVPAVGVSTLAVLAAKEIEAGGGDAVTAAIDAKRGEIYLQAFNSQGVASTEAVVVSVEDARTTAAAFEGRITGSGAALLAGEGREADVDHYPIRTLARLASAEGASMVRPKPLYLRGPDAKPQSGFALARK
ncbi:tRNA (adenosine(37)-N6)-threonylcarbamoyltransferase complex dimerization subunit type 1 TsaB [Rhizobium sp. PAMB 3182]